MRSIRLLFFILSLPALVEGAWTRVGTFAVGNDVVTDNQMVIATSATLEAGNVGAAAEETPGEQPPCAHRDIISSTDHHVAE